jgi:hypothetical protein
MNRNQYLLFLPVFIAAALFIVGSIIFIKFL